MNLDNVERLVDDNSMRSSTFGCQSCVCWDTKSPVFNNSPPSPQTPAPSWVWTHEMLCTLRSALSSPASSSHTFQESGVYNNQISGSHVRGASECLPGAAITNMPWNIGSIFFRLGIRGDDVVACLQWSTQFGLSLEENAFATELVRTSRKTRLRRKGAAFACLKHPAWPKLFTFTLVLQRWVQLTKLKKNDWTASEKMKLISSAFRKKKDTLQIFFLTDPSSKPQVKFCWCHFRRRTELSIKQLFFFKNEHWWKYI